MYFIFFILQNWILKGIGYFLTVRMCTNLVFMYSLVSLPQKLVYLSVQIVLKFDTRHKWYFIHLFFWLKMPLFFIFSNFEINIKSCWVFSDSAIVHKPSYRAFCSVSASKTCLLPLLPNLMLKFDTRQMILYIYFFWLKMPLFFIFPNFKINIKSFCVFSDSVIVHKPSYRPFCSVSASKTCLLPFYPIWC